MRGRGDCSCACESLGDFPPIYGGRDFPPINPEAPSPNISPFLALDSIGPDQIREMDPRKLRLFGIKVYRSTDQTTIGDSTTTAVTFNAVSFNEGFATPGATFTTVTIPFTGVYELIGQVEWNTIAAGDYAVWFYVNAAAKEGTATRSTSIFARQNISAVRRMTAGDTVGLRVRQETGGNMDLQGAEEDLALTVILLGFI